MILSGSFLEGVASEEFAPFFGQADYDAVDRFAREFPFAVQAHVLELRLTSEKCHPDYQVCLRDERETVESIRQGLCSAGLSSPPVEEFLRVWAEADSPLRESLPLLWLEFDRPAGEFSRAPGVFVAPDEKAAIQTQMRAVAATFELLYPRHIAQRHIDHIAAVQAVLPRTARIKHIGALPSRRPDFMRLVLEGVHDDQTLAGLLTELGWPGDIHYLKEVLALLQAKGGVVPSLIDLDFFSGVGPNLGLELLLRGGYAPSDSGKALLALMETQNWCSAEKLRMLDRWRSWTITEPDRLAPWALWYKLYHVKLTVKPLQQVPSAECKAYWAAWSGPKRRMLDELQKGFKAHGER